MTALAAVPVAAEALSDEQREAGLVELARDADWKTHENVMCDLAMLAHPSLSPGRRAEQFEVYCQAAVNFAALKANVAEWQEFYDDGEFCADADPHVRALDLLDDQAREAMFALKYGEDER